jgi:L-threonylcarbamoyladenylate synthase
MFEVLDWQRVADPRAVVRRAVDELRAGRTVGFPTESSYALVASGLNLEAVDRLHFTKDGRPETLAAAVDGLFGAREWVPGLSPLAQRLARRFWPGPLILHSAEGMEGGLAERLPTGVRQLLSPNGSLRLRSPAHEAILDAVQLFAGPLVLCENAGATSAELQQQSSDRIDLLIDDGPSPSAQPPTVIQVQGKNWSVLRPGALTTEQVAQQSACIVIFVCTGNTCRSPLAEGFCKKLLAERLGCTIEDLPRRGFYVLSAGLAAMMGGEAAAESVAVAHDYGADLARHQSRPLSEDLAAQADFLIVMTRGHLSAITEYYPRLGCRPRLLCPQGEDIADPVGASREVYQACAVEIWRHLEPLVAEIAEG